MKRIIALVLTLVVLMPLLSVAHAAEGTVTYDGNAQQFIFAPGSDYSPTDLFPDFKDVMPGDTLVQKITVKNQASNQVKVKIYIRALGAHTDSQDFLSQLRLAVKPSDDNQMAFMFDAAASETAQLTDWVCLGTLYSGGQVNLDVLLDVPVELGNEYQNAVGYLDWEFRVEEYPISSDDPAPPQTGDDFNMGLWLGLLIGSALAIVIALLVWRKKKKDNPEGIK